MKLRAINLKGLGRATRRLARREQGTQLVELAIVLPVVVLMFASIAEFGRYFYTYTTLAKATRAGARYLATAENKAAEDTLAKNLVIYGNFDGTGTPVIEGLTSGKVTITRGGTPEMVTIKIVDFKYQPVFDLGAITGRDGLSLKIDVKPSTTMRYIFTQPLL